MIHRPVSVRLSFALGLVLSVTVAWPAAADPDEKSVNALQPGAWALQFGIDDNFQLDSFEGSMISLKHHTSAGSAWRLGVSTHVSSNDRDESRHYVSPDTTFTDSDNTDLLGLFVGLTRIHYPHPGERVSAYYGAGPWVSIFNADNSRTNGTDESHQENSSWAAGAGFVFGGEWFAARSLGIHAEYRASIGYEKRRDTNTPPPSAGVSYTLENESWSVRSNGVQFGASWYF